MLQIIKNAIDNNILVHIDRAFDKPNISDGFQETSKRQIDKDGDYQHEPGVLGAFTKRDIFDGLDMRKFRPVGEQQNDVFEKMWCVSESANNNKETNGNAMIHLEGLGKLSKDELEILKIARHFGLIKGDKWLLDTNYTAIGSGTTRRGNSQKKVGNFIRHYGIVPKGTVPVGKDWNSNYYRKDGVRVNGNKLPKEALELGKKIAEYLDIKYEWVAPQNSAKTYKYGVLQTSCRAPSPLRNGIYQRTTLQRNHANQRDHDPKTHIDVFDSYDPFEKKYALNYAFGWGMLYTIKLKKKLEPFNKDYIQSLKKKWDYVLLVNDCGTYSQGVYKLLEDSIEKADLKVMLDNGVKKLKIDGKLEGINSEDFKRIVNL